MSVYLVTWEINNAKAAYKDVRAKLLERIKKYNSIKDPGLDSAVFISSTIRASELSADIKIALDSDDRLFVTKINSNEYDGWLHQDVWDWIKARL